MLKHLACGGILRDQSYDAQLQIKLKKDALICQKNQLVYSKQH